MYKKKDSSFIHKMRFNKEFRFERFKEYPRYRHRELAVQANLNTGLSVSIQGIGNLEENIDYVVLSIKQYQIYSQSNSVLACSFTTSIVNVKGERKIPRMFTRWFREEHFENVYEYEGPYVEERYIKRNFILNNIDEYVRNDVIIFHVEVNVEVYDNYLKEPISYWKPLTSAYNFDTKQCNDGLQVYLRNDSVHAPFLMQYSKVFKGLWKDSVRKSGDVSSHIAKEVLPAFLCMLYFIETKNLILHEVTIFDLYKISHKYDVPIMLQECRNRIKETLPQNAPAIIDIATLYNDMELKQIAKSYLRLFIQGIGEDNAKIETENCLNEDFVPDASPYHSDLIKTTYDFKYYLQCFWKKINFDNEMDFTEIITNFCTYDDKTDRESFEFYK